MQVWMAVLCQGEGKEDVVVAVKQLQCMNLEQRKRAMRELLLLQETATLKGVVPFYGSAEDLIEGDKNIYACFALYSYRDLHKVLHDFEHRDRVGFPERHLSLKRRLSWVRDMLQILLMVHSYCLVHRDIKPANLLVAEDLTLALADFGLTECLATVASKITVCCCCCCC